MPNLRPILAAAALVAAGPAPAATQSPYAGEESKEIASLSAEDVRALLAGEGWGFARPAELNGYPGPRHVLDLAAELGLSSEQEAAVQAVFDAMNAEARRLGAEYVAAEAALDAAFEAGGMDHATLEALVAETARIRGALRAAHLAAHLETQPILTRRQLHDYDRLRGYAGGGDAHGHAHGGHGAD